MEIRDRIRELRRVPARDLQPSPRNWRTHPASQRDALRGILAEVGYADALLARELPGGALELIDGHLRAETTPDQPVPVLVLDLDEAEAAKLLACLDPLAALAGADAARLESLLAEVSTGSPALEAMLGELAERSGILAEAPAGGGGDDFDATPEQGPTRTNVGELWAIGPHQLLVGDCTVRENVERLLGGEKADLVLTDPPYGVDFKRGQFITDPSRRSSRARGVGDELAGDHRKAGDQQAFIRAVFALWKDHVRPAASVYMWSATLVEGSHSMLGLAEAGVHVQSQLVWVKNNLVLGIADYQWKHEVCWYGWYAGISHRWFGERDKTTVLAFQRVASTEHPSEKPVDLIAHFISNSTLPGDLVADPFLGSGTTLVAAHRLKRRCCGCEIEPRYADVVLKRAEAEGLTCTRME